MAERLQAWKHAVVYLEEYFEAVEKLHKAQAKEYERVLKVCNFFFQTAVRLRLKGTLTDLPMQTISKPLREGDHFDQSLGGVAGSSGEFGAGIGITLPVGQSTPRQSYRSNQGEFALPAEALNSYRQQPQAWRLLLRFKQTTTSMAAPPLNP